MTLFRRRERLDCVGSTRTACLWRGRLEYLEGLRSDGSSHQHVGTVPGLAKRGYGFEPLLREHRRSSVGGLISESVRFPTSDGIGLHQAPSFLFYGFQSGLQRSGRHPAFAILF